MKPGDTLPNGATVIAFALIERDYAKPRAVVLAMRTHETYEPYVTWTLWPDEPDSTVDGHYFLDVVDAAGDFHTRCRR